MGKRFSELETPNGHLVGEAASALQSRSAKEENALYWASELDLTGFGNYVWRRLRIIASEDVGPADPMVAVQVRQLYETGSSSARRRRKCRRRRSRRHSS
jgi:replication-associated recombination protein RarA